MELKTMPTITFRLSETEHKILKSAAKKRRQTVTGFLKELIKESEENQYEKLLINIKSILQPHFEEQTKWSRIIRKNSFRAYKASMEQIKETLGQNRFKEIDSAIEQSLEIIEKRQIQTENKPI